MPMHDWARCPEAAAETAECYHCGEHRVVSGGSVATAWAQRREGCNGRVELRNGVVDEAEGELGADFCPAGPGGPGLVGTIHVKGLEAKAPWRKPGDSSVAVRHPEGRGDEIEREQILAATRYPEARVGGGECFKTVNVGNGPGTTEAATQGPGWRVSKVGPAMFATVRAPNCRPMLGSVADVARHLYMMSGLWAGQMQPFTPWMLGPLLMAGLVEGHKYDHEGEALFVGVVWSAVAAEVGELPGEGLRWLVYDPAKDTAHLAARRDGDSTTISWPILPTGPAFNPKTLNILPELGYEALDDGTIRKTQAKEAA